MQEQSKHNGNIRVGEFPEPINENDNHSWAVWGSGDGEEGMERHIILIPCNHNQPSGDRQMDRQTGRQTDRQIDRHADRWTDNRQVSTKNTLHFSDLQGAKALTCYMQVGQSKLVGRQADRHADRQMTGTDRKTD